MKIDIPEATIKSLLTGIFESYPEYSAGNALKCTDYNYTEFIYEFLDTEEDKRYTLTYEKARKGFKKLLLELADKPDEFSSFNVFDAGEYDCERTDMLLQYALLGEVIYG